LTPLEVLPGTLKSIGKIERAFLWSAKSTTTRAKGKVNWKTVFRQKKLGGLGIMNLEKCATTLLLRWPWLEWTCLNKILVGYGNSCTCEDMDIFYAATTITLGTIVKTPFGKLLGLVRGNSLILPRLFLHPRSKKKMESL
jgi:hypothetical protein